MRGVLLLIVAVAAAAAVGAQQAPVRSWTLSPRLIPSPAGAASAQPQLTVSSRGVLLSWIEQSEGVPTLKFSERTSTGWTPPVRVASGTDWFVNWADVPSVLRLRDGTVVAHWLQKSGPGTYAYDVRLSYSADDGRTWAPAITPHSDGTKTEHGFASLFQMPGAGGLGVVWLDGRAMTGQHGGHASGEMSLRFAAFDRRWKQISEVPIDTRVCECCPTAAALTAEGPVVAFRNRGPDETRDIHISRFENGKWSEPAAAHADDWQIHACPVNGPALSASGRRVVLAWFTGKDDQPRAFAAFSSDAGRTFGTPIRLDDGAALGRVDVELLPDGSAAATYIDSSDRKPRLMVRRIERDGTRSQPIALGTIEDGRASGYPRMARHGGELVFAWIEREGTLRVRTAVASIEK